jgi:hypothetical protein
MYKYFFLIAFLLFGNPELSLAADTGGETADAAGKGISDVLCHVIDLFGNKKMQIQRYKNSKQRDFL